MQICQNKTTCKFLNKFCLLCLIPPATLLRISSECPQENLAFVKDIFFQEDIRENWKPLIPERQVKLASPHSQLELGLRQSPLKEEVKDPFLRRCAELCRQKTATDNNRYRVIQEEMVGNLRDKFQMLERIYCGKIGGLVDLVKVENVNSCHLSTFLPYRKCGQEILPHL